MTTTINRLPTSLAEAVTTLDPLIRRNAGSAERNRVMAPEIMEALVASGLMRMWVPQAYGGLEADPNESLDVMEQLARIDAATGWVVSNCVFISTLPQFLPEPVRAHIAGDPAIVACGSFVPPGTARATADGYIINGDWSFGSATQYATSIVTLNVLVDEEGELVLDGGNPVSIVAYFTRDDIEFRDTWFTLGLRATGSTNFVAKELAIPTDHTFVLGSWEQQEGPFAGPLYRLGLIMDAVRIAKVGVGIAQGAVDDFVELATAKTPAYTAVVTADRPQCKNALPERRHLCRPAGTPSVRASAKAGRRSRTAAALPANDVCRWGWPRRSPSTLPPKPSTSSTNPEARPPSATNPRCSAGSGTSRPCARTPSRPGAATNRSAR